MLALIYFAILLPYYVANKLPHILQHLKLLTFYIYLCKFASFDHRSRQAYVLLSIYAATRVTSKIRVSPYS